MRRLRPLLAFLSVTAFAAPAAAQSRDTPPARAELWPVKTREFVDLWLHGFALLSDDSARVPLFRRGYRDAVTVEKNRRGIVTDLDANAEGLRAQLVAHPSLAQAQFAALAFEGEAEMDRGFEAFFAAAGDPRKASDRLAAQMITYLAGYFPQAEDRDWARTFTNSLKSERAKFHHAWWVDEQRRRAPALAAGDSLWQHMLRPALSRFLGSTRQEGGSLLFSLPVEGEGRTVTLGGRQNVIVVPLPDSATAAAEPLFVAAHELVGAVTPPMAEGYARFYLRVARVSYASDPLEALERAFPLNADLAGTLRRQIGLAFGGI